MRIAYHARIQLWAAGFYKTEGLSWDVTTMTGSPFKYFAYGAAVSEVEVDGFTGAYDLRRVDIVHDVGDSLSPLVDLGQVEGGFVQGAGWLTLEDLRWDTSDGANRGRLSTQSASTYKLPSFSEMPTEFNVALLDHAHEDGAVYGSKAVGEPPLMLAFSVREALREACAAFGPPGVSLELASPATPEAVYWALDRVALRGAGMTTWWQAVADLRASREAGVLVTVTDVRGHAPRDAGAKMVVSARETTGSVGGGNLEAEAVRRARALLEVGRDPARVVRQPPVGQGADPARRPVLRRRGVGAAGAVARGAGGRDLRGRPRRSRAGAHPGPPRPRPAPGRLAGPSTCPPRCSAPLADSVAAVHVHPVPVLPELVLAELPPGTHLLVMTHDHAEDVALCDAAIRLDHLGPDRADRVVGQAGAVPVAAARRRARPDRGRPDPHAHRPARRDDQQGAGRDRGRRGGRAAGSVRA